MCVYAYNYVVCMSVFLFTATMVLCGISRLRIKELFYLMILLYRKLNRRLAMYFYFQTYGAYIL